MKKQSVKSKKLKGQSQVFIQSLVNRNIGSRTGKDVKAGKIIDKDKDGFDNFEAYWSESDADLTSNTTAHSIFSSVSAGQEKENQLTNQGPVTSSQPVGVKVNHSARLQSVDSYSSQPIAGAAAYYFGHRAVGSRTGRNIKAGKNIHKFDDSFENFENYWSESEPDSILSFHKSVRVSDSKSFISTDIAQEEDFLVMSLQSDSEVIINPKHLSNGFSRDSFHDGSSATTQEERVSQDKDTSLLGDPHSKVNLTLDADTGEVDDQSTAEERSVLSVKEEKCETEVKTESDQGCSEQDDHCTNQQIIPHDGVRMEKGVEHSSQDSVEQGLPECLQSADTENSQDVKLTVTRSIPQDQPGITSSLTQKVVLTTKEEQNTTVKTGIMQTSQDEVSSMQSTHEAHVDVKLPDQSRSSESHQAVTEELGEDIADVTSAAAKNVPSRRTRSQSRGSSSGDNMNDQTRKLSGKQMARQPRKKSHTVDEDSSINLSSAKEMASSIKKSRNKKKKSEDTGKNENVTVTDCDDIDLGESARRKKGRQKVTEEKDKKEAMSTRSTRRSARNKSQTHDGDGQCGVEKVDILVQNTRKSCTTDAEQHVHVASNSEPNTCRRSRSKPSETNTGAEVTGQLVISQTTEAPTPNMTDLGDQISTYADMMEPELSGDGTRIPQSIGTDKHPSAASDINLKSKEVEETVQSENIYRTEEENTGVLKLKAVKSTRKSFRTRTEKKGKLQRKSLAGNLFPSENDKVLVSNMNPQGESEVVFDKSPDNTTLEEAADNDEEFEEIVDSVEHENSANDVSALSPTGDVCDQDPVADSEQDSSHVISFDGKNRDVDVHQTETKANHSNSKTCVSLEEGESASNEVEFAPSVCPSTVHTADDEPSSKTVTVNVHKEATPSELLFKAPSGKISATALLNIGGDVTGSISKNTDFTGTVSNTPMHSFRTKKRLSYSRILDDSMDKERQKLTEKGTSSCNSGSTIPPSVSSIVEEYSGSDGHEDPNTEFLSLQPSTRKSVATTDTDSMDENFWIVDEGAKEKKKRLKTQRKNSKVFSKKNSGDVSGERTGNQKKSVSKAVVKKSSEVKTSSKKVGSKRRGKNSVSGDETSGTDTQSKTNTTNKRKSGSRRKQSDGVPTDLDNVVEEQDADAPSIDTDTSTSTKVRKRKSHDPSQVTMTTVGKKPKSARVTKTREVMKGSSRKSLTVKSNNSMSQLSHLNLAGVGETPKSGVSFRQWRRRSLSDSEKSNLNVSCPAELSSSPHIDSSQQLDKRKSLLPGKPDTPPAVGPLTPCLVLSETSKSVEKKKRRVTISNIIEKASVSYTDSTGSESHLNVSKSSPAGCTDSSPADITGSPIHIFETTTTERPDPITAPPKTKIIYPKPGPEGLRRSQRVRLEPLEWYKNEHVIYQRRKSGNFVIAGVQPSKEAEYIAAEMEKKKKRAKQRLKQTKSSKMSRSKLLTKANLSIHQRLPADLDYTIHNELPIINPETQEEVLVDCVAPEDNRMYVGSGGNSPGEGDPYIISHAIQQPTFTAGNLLIAPLAEKPTQMLSENTLIFTIIHGKLCVTIHRGSIVLEAGDQFFVPRGNTYCLKNLRNEEAKLSFVNLIEEDGS